MVTSLRVQEQNSILCNVSPLTTVTKTECMEIPEGIQRRFAPADYAVGITFESFISPVCNHQVGTLGSQYQNNDNNNTSNIS